MKRREIETASAKKNTRHRIEELISEMTLIEKIGQMSQFAGGNGLNHNLMDHVRDGKVGSILNQVGVDVLNEMQRVAVEESRLGIPIIFGRDVIHGFQTVFPIPLGQAASWNPNIPLKGARVAATEAARGGIHWTFAPMVDITRDPRWGRIAESLGEDPHLASKLGAAMVRGFQGDDLSDTKSIAACAKHFAGYGYSEAGKDYAYVNISDNEMRNIVLPPFKACVDAGVATFMTAFSDLNGIPATAHENLMKEILKGEWNYDGFVVSDWDSVIQLITHGFSKNPKAAAEAAQNAGLDMEMASHTFLQHLEALVGEGAVFEENLNDSVRRILKVKFDLGLFERPYTDVKLFPENGNEDHLAVAKEAAIESLVLLKNDYQTLPLNLDRIKDIAVIGPLADDGFEQMGTWTFDGKESWSQTPLQALKKELGENVNIRHARGLHNTRDNSEQLFKEAIEIAKKSDTVIFFMGEESILSGEAHCRADINLPGAQNKLLEQISKLGKSTILVAMAGRPLILERTRHLVNSLVYAWHPGTMGGPAIVDVLLGKSVPSGKLPVSFPKAVGQIPIYYNQRNSGKPATHESFTHINDIPQRAPQTSVGNTSFHLDAGFEPLYPFGFGLSYTHFEYHNLRLSTHNLNPSEKLIVSVDVFNAGAVNGHEVVQLYIRDLFASITRPVKELKAFEKIFIQSGETTTVSFELSVEDLSFVGKDNKTIWEPGIFQIWIGGDSNAWVSEKFELMRPNTENNEK
jgi:beta-glucosidase